MKWLVFGASASGTGIFLRHSHKATWWGMDRTLRRPAGEIKGPTNTPTSFAGMQNLYVELCTLKKAFTGALAFMHNGACNAEPRQMISIVTAHPCDDNDANDQEKGANNVFWTKSGNQAEIRPQCSRKAFYSHKFKPIFWKPLGAKHPHQIKPPSLWDNGTIRSGP